MPPRRRAGVVAGGVYGVMFLLGAVEALLGSFEYGWMVGTVPAAAIGCCVALLVTCLLAGWGMRSFGGSLAPAVGWVVVSFVLAMPTTEGSVIIADTVAGRWYLYGGLVAAAIGALVTFVAWARRPTSP